MKRTVIRNKWEPCITIFYSNIFYPTTPLKSCQGRKAKNEKDNASVSAQDRALFDKLAKNIFVPSYTDGILEKGFGAFYLLWDVRNGGDINQTLAQYETTYQKMIEDANILLSGWERNVHPCNNTIVPSFPPGESR